LRFLKGGLTAREDEISRGIQLFEGEKPWRVNPKRVSGMKQGRKASGGESR
jgi:hypothetical protein